MALFAQRLLDIFCCDELPGGGDGQLPDDTAELGVVMGPLEVLEQGDSLRFCPMICGTGRVQVAERQVYQGRDTLCHLPQRWQVKREATQLIHKQGADCGGILSRLTDTGKNDPVPPAYLHFGQNVQKLPPPLQGQCVDAGKVQGVGGRPEENYGAPAKKPSSCHSEGCS